MYVRMLVEGTGISITADCGRRAGFEELSRQMDGAGSFTAYCQESTRLHAIRRKCNRFPGHLADAIDADRHVRARVSEAKI